MSLFHTVSEILSVEYSGFTVKLSLEVIKNGTIQKLEYGFLFVFHYSYDSIFAVSTQYTNVTASEPARHTDRPTLHGRIGCATWPHLRCDVGLEEGEYKYKLSRCSNIVYCYNGAQRYEQFLQVGRLYRALILLGLALCLSSASVSSVLMVLYR